MSFVIKNSKYAVYSDGGGSQEQEEDLNKMIDRMSSEVADNLVEELLAGQILPEKLKEKVLSGHFNNRLAHTLSTNAPSADLKFKALGQGDVSITTQRTFDVFDEQCLGTDEELALINYHHKGCPLAISPSGNKGKGGNMTKSKMNQIKRMRLKLIKRQKTKDKMWKEINEEVEKKEKTKVKLDGAHMVKCAKVSLRIKDLLKQGKIGKETAHIANLMVGEMVEEYANQEFLDEWRDPTHWGVKDTSQFKSPPNVSTRGKGGNISIRRIKRMGKKMMTKKKKKAQKKKARRRRRR
jgi:hypothetical protein